MNISSARAEKPVDETVEIASYFANDRRLVDGALGSYLARNDGTPDKLAAAMLYTVLGPGKRLRPLLAIEACRICGGLVDAALPVAAAVEMIHAYSLAHDDLPAMDNDDLRRGRPTVHLQFDEATAILVGDALIPLAFEVISRDVRPAEKAVRCIHELAIAAGRSNLVGGQSDDLAAERDSLPGNLDFLESIHLRKTAALLAVSLRLGAIVANGTDKQVNSLDSFGKKIGLAFQITDDLLDFEGNPAKMGKRAEKDASRGKCTYPQILSPEDCRRLAEEIVSSAVDDLADFGKAGLPLASIARSILSRSS